MFQPTKEWVNKVNLLSFELENFFKFGACVISARKAKQLDATTMLTYSHANTTLSQSERAYYLSYFLKPTSSEKRRLFVGKKVLKSSFNNLKLFCLNIFDQLVRFY